MILPHPGGGTCVDGSDIEKINEIIGILNALCNSSSAQPHLVHIAFSESGMVYDFQGLISAIEKTIVAPLKS